MLQLTRAVLYFGLQQQSKVEKLNSESRLRNLIACAPSPRGPYSPSALLNSMSRTPPGLGRCISGTSGDMVARPSHRLEKRSGRAVGTGIKGSQFHQVERSQVFEILIGGDGVRT